jgi:glycine cleavage system H protein
MSKVYFSEDHEWIRVDGENAEIGITDYAQEQLGDVVFVDLPDAGKQLEKGEEAAVVESVKAASEVYSAVSGEVTEVNEALADDPSKVNGDPMGEGWFLKLKLSKLSELDDLMDEAGYNDYVADLD